MMMEIFTWPLAVVSVAATLLNIRKHWSGFAIWSVTNTAWMIINAADGKYAPAAMFAVYLVLSLWGLRAWLRPPKAKGEDRSRKTEVRSQESGVRRQTAKR